VKPIYQYVLLGIYTVFHLTLFWYAQFFLECIGFFCNVVQTFLIWIFFIATTFTLYLIKPLSFKKALLRFLFGSLLMILIYCVYYNSLDQSTWSDNRWFLDYSLPGILLTIGFTVIWFIPINLNRK
jgi:hypothetical protein